MSEPTTTVYILGAGCSVNYGYPLAKDFVNKLKAFSADLKDDCQGIKKCVDSTVALMEKMHVATVDDLVSRIDSGICDENIPNTQKTGVRVQRIRNAKIATEVYFLSLEAAARKSGLDSYHGLLHKILPGARPWYQRLVSCDSHVLTFNYDRLFEMSFLERFAIQTEPLYGPTVLNAGLGAVDSSLVDFATGRFCFLKLHGSVGGWRANRWYGNPRFYHDCHGPAVGETFIANDEIFDEFWKPREPIMSEVLLTFPHEKADSLLETSPRSFLHRNYIQHVWRQANRLIEQASEIWVIGYSFAALDLNEFIKLLRNTQNCKRIVVQNPQADAICRRLRVEYPDIGAKLVPHLDPF
jgi:hypothetical protein